MLHRLISFVYHHRTLILRLNFIHRTRRILCQACLFVAVFVRDLDYTLLNYFVLIIYLFFIYVQIDFLWVLWQ